MSVTTELYSDLYVLGEPLFIRVRNNTNQTVNIYVKFFDGTETVLVVVFENVSSGDYTSVLIPYELIKDVLEQKVGKTLCVQGGLPAGIGGGGEYWL